MTDEIHFGRFCLDLAQGGLLREGKLVPLGNRALEILIVLASAKGEIVTKDDLMARVWPGRVVEENNIQVHVSALRKALDDGDAAGSCVVTVPGRGYRLVGTPSPVLLGRTAAVPEAAEYSSIAVLPFQNMSDDPDQDHFTDGIVEDIITGLARIRWLSVIARSSSSAYGNHNVDVRRICSELGAQYVLAGSVRKEGKRLRVTAQLISAVTGAHLWADRFEDEIADSFHLQDEITESVIGAIAPELQQAEIDRARRKPTEHLDAYDYFLRGMAREVADLAGGLEQPTSDGTSEALRLFYSAVELDPSFASAYGMAALCYAQRKAFDWMGDREQENLEAASLARKAVQIGKDDAVALATGGYVLAFVVHEIDAGVAAIERALILNPNFAAAWLFLGWTKVWLGQPDVAIEHLECAMRLSPLGRGIAGMQAAVAHAHFFAGRFDEACAWAGRLLREFPASHPGLRIAAASNAAAGRIEEARKAAARLRELDPAFRVANLKKALGPYSAEALLKYEEAMSRAGLE